MATVCITGSTDGIGLSAARLLLQRGHTVLVHARSGERGRPVVDELEEQGDVRLVVGDLADLEEVGDLADAIGAVDVLVHNAGVYLRAPGPVSAQGYELTFAVNVLAPFVLTMLLGDVVRERLVFLGSGLAASGHVDPETLGATTDPDRAYADSKAADVLLALAWARRLPSLRVGAVDPGWVRTKLATPGAPGDVAAGGRRLVAAVLDDAWPGGFTVGVRPAKVPAALTDERLQDDVLRTLDAMSRRYA